MIAPTNPKFSTIKPASTAGGTVLYSGAGFYFWWPTTMAVGCALEVVD